MHNGGVIFDADFGGNFSGAETEFFGEEIHGDLAGGFNIADAGFATQVSAAVLWPLVHFLAGPLDGAELAEKILGDDAGTGSFFSGADRPL
mgnify:CR=1 FL=1